MTQPLTVLAKRALRGRHSVVLCAGGLVPLGSDANFAIIRVDCRLTPRPLEPLAALEREVHALLGPARSTSEWPQRMLSARRRVLGETADRALLRDLVNDLNCLAALSRRSLAVVFHAAQAAHPSTLHALSRLVARASLDVPFVIGVEPNATDIATPLLAAAREVDGEAAIIDLVGRVDDRAPSPRAETAARSSADAALPALSEPAMRVLRAAAAVGSPFEPHLIGQLTSLSAIEVLQALQAAADAGVPLLDRGDGRLGLPDDLADHLTSTTLPSLTRAWHQRAAELLAVPYGREPPPTRRAREPSDLGRGKAQEHHAAETQSAQPPTPRVETREHTAVRPPRAERPTAAGAEPAAPDLARRDAARAADHASRAGDTDLAVEQLVAATRRALELGAFDEALRTVEKGIAYLDKNPESAHRNQLRVALMTELAAVHWLASGIGPEFSLPGALETLSECLRLLGPQDPPKLRAHVLSTIAHVRYDMGDRESLEEALRALTQAQRELLEAGESVEAARLLNDEAEVWLRIGDVVRANGLLNRSREVFESFAIDDGRARAELAQTDHLLARLILRTPPRPGKEADALRLGVENAQTAIETYRSLKRPLDVARVQETLGRLEAARGNNERAAQHLIEAGDTQSRLGDAIGVARTAAALSELLASSGEAEQALELLVRSASVNREKGTPQGLAFNRNGLEALLRRLPPEQHLALEPWLSRLSRQLVT